LPAEIASVFAEMDAIEASNTKPKKKGAAWRAGAQAPNQTQAKAMGGQMASQKIRRSLRSLHGTGWQSINATETTWQVAEIAAAPVSV
jgi:hypothetical protein